jgi:pyruvate formate lyase activating enzyme
MNIDLKSSNPAFYRTLGGEPEAVKAAIAAASDACHVEVTTLVIPGQNDSADEMEALSAWLSTISPEIPLHITRFFPKYQMTDLPPTPVSSINTLVKTAKRHLKHVYTGNL